MHWGAVRRWKAEPWDDLVADLRKAADAAELQAEDLAQASADFQQQGETADAARQAIAEIIDEVRAQHTDLANLISATAAFAAEIWQVKRYVRSAQARADTYNLSISYNGTVSIPSNTTVPGMALLMALDMVEDDVKRAVSCAEQADTDYAARLRAIQYHYCTPAGAVPAAALMTEEELAQLLYQKLYTAQLMVMPNGDVVHCAGWTAEQAHGYAADIANMAAKASEPYRTLFFQRIGEVNISTPLFGFTFHNPLTNTIHIDLASLPNESPAPFYTLFHEVGHAIDNAERDDGLSGMNQYRSGEYTYNHYHLDDLIAQDVRNRLVQTLQRENPSASAAQINTITDAIMNQEYSSLSGNDRAVAERLRATMSNELKGTSCRTLGDAYGSTTGNVIKGNWGHTEPGWDTNDDGVPDGYWTVFPGTPGEAETFAGYFADQMTESTQRETVGADGQTSLDITREYLGQTVEAMDHMAQGMAATR